MVNATLQIPNSTPFAESSSSAIPGMGSSPAFTFENGLRTAGALVTPSWILKNSPNLYFAHMVGDVEHHLVLPGDPAEPGFELRIGGCPTAVGLGARGGRCRSDEIAQTEGGGSGGEPAQESPAVRGEAAEIEHRGKSPVGWKGSRISAAPGCDAACPASDTRRRAAGRRWANRTSCPGSPGAGAHRRTLPRRGPAGRSRSRDGRTACCRR